MAKLYKTYDDLLIFLQKEKNLIIHDQNAAKHILLKTGYFSLISGYKNNFKNPTTNKYIDGTTFEDIYHLYRFDHELRSLFLKYILVAEHSVKTSLAYHFSSVYGEQQEEYLKHSHYSITTKNQKNVSKLIRILSYPLTHESNYQPITHYKNKHNNVPLWILIQSLTLGQFSHMFDYLNATAPIRVCNDFHQIRRKDMHSFLSIMTKHRNVCAHGERFFNYITKDCICNTPLHSQLSIPQKNGRYIYGKNDIFSEVIILKYLLDKKDFFEFFFDLEQILKKYTPAKNILENMGFPTNWKTILPLKF